MSFTLHEVWQARELLYFLVWRDVKVRYKQTVLGIGWSVLQPFLTMVVFTIFFGRLAKMPSDGVPYPVFSLAALVPWTYFATAASNGSESLVGNQHLVAKVYFPRVLVPLAAVLMPAVDLVVSFGMLLVLLAWYHVMPTQASCAAAVCRTRRPDCVCGDALDVRAERPVSGRPLRPAVCHSDLAVRDARGVPGLDGSRTVAADLRAQSDGDGRRGLQDRAAGNAGTGRDGDDRSSDRGGRADRRGRIFPIR